MYGFLGKGDQYLADCTDCNLRGSNLPAGDCHYLHAEENAERKKAERGTAERKNAEAENAETENVEKECFGDSKTEGDFG